MFRGPLLQFWKFQRKFRYSENLTENTFCENYKSTRQSSQKLHNQYELSLKFPGKFFEVSLTICTDENVGYLIQIIFLGNIYGCRVFFRLFSVHFGSRVQQCLENSQENSCNFLEFYSDENITLMRSLRLRRTAT